MVILFLNMKQFIKTHFEYWLSFNLQHLSKLVNNAIARSWSISTKSSSFPPAFWCHLENNLEEQVIKGGTKVYFNTQEKPLELLQMGIMLLIPPYPP